MNREMPTMMGWEITRRCNLTCPHCYSAATRKALNELTTTECLEIVRTIGEMGVKMVGWTGGEPLLREDLEEIAGAARKFGMKQGVTTNGVLLDEKRGKSLMKAGVTAMQVSIDGTTAERNRPMRNASDEEFEKALEAVRVSVRLGFKTSLAMMIGQENLDDAPRFIHMAKKMKAHVVRFSGFVPHGRGKGQRSRLEFTTRLGELKAFVSQFTGYEKMPIAFDPGFGPLPPYYEFHQCIAGKQMFYLSCIGDVYPCTSLLSKEFVVGNVRQRPLIDIWNDPNMTKMAEIPREKIHGPCRTCRYMTVCHGACRGASYAHTGDLFASFPVCLRRVRIKKNPAMLVKNVRSLK
ncbi:Radical SAM domain protein [Candidatus Zixiibacteriota bacterium]|nr:Radical SAM domain protein [candidate division Zixibacteria bacterium]